MTSGFIVRLRPTGPWRLGPSTGARDRVDRVLHSDALFSALTIAAEKVGILSEWLAATAEAVEPAVRVGSAFPFVGRTLLAPAPKHVWPPPIPGKVRWKAAQFVPLQIVPRLLAYEALKEDRWAVDPISQCVLPIEKFGEVTPPFRISLRRTAAVDRLTSASAEAGTTACLEFAEGAGLWCAVECSDEWRERAQSLFRFLADSGIGGERSLGWGRSEAPEFEPLPPALTASALESDQHETGFWLLSLFAPADSDRLDWSRGSYSLLRRSGRTERRGDLKLESALAEEGSVLIGEAPPIGRARDIAPEGNVHPIYRAGFAVSVPVAVRLPGFHALERPPEAPPVAEDADGGAFEDALAVPAPELPEEPAESTALDAIAIEAEPFEDAAAEPEPMPEPEQFEAETSPIETPSAETEPEPIEDAPAEPTLPDPESAGEETPAKEKPAEEKLEDEKPGDQS